MGGLSTCYSHTRYAHSPTREWSILASACREPGPGQQVSVRYAYQCPLNALRVARALRQEEHYIALVNSYKLQRHGVSPLRSHHDDLLSSGSGGAPTTNPFVEAGEALATTDGFLEDNSLGHRALDDMLHQVLRSSSNMDPLTREKRLTWQVFQCSFARSRAVLSLGPCLTRP